jgi:hypothetical protein
MERVQFLGVTVQKRYDFNPENRINDTENVTYFFRTINLFVMKITYVKIIRNI